MPAHARTATRKRALTSDKIREYILGDEQLQMTQKGTATRLTPIQVIERVLDSDESRRVRSHAPPAKKNDRL